MPLYDYECPACGLVEEHQVRIDDPAPTCCGQPMTRLISVPGLVRIAGPSGLIIGGRDRIEREFGSDWRDKGTTRREGGAGERLIFDQGRR